MAAESILLSTLVHMVTIRLTASNYLLWRNQVLPMLRLDRLLSIVDGSETAPSPTVTDEGKTAPNPDFLAWTRRHDRALSLLLSSLTEEAMAEVLGLTDVTAVWRALEAAFCPSSESRANQLRDELQFLQRGTASVSEFERKFNSLCHQLAAIGSHVQDSDKSRWFLRGLGPDYRTFADVRLALATLLSFTDLLSQARDHELRLKSDLSNIPSPQAAFVTGRQSTGRGSNSGQRNHQQQQTGRSGNISGGQNQQSGRSPYPSRSTAPTRQQGPPSADASSGQSGRKPFIPRCQICKKDHFATDCPDRYTNKNAYAANVADAFQQQCNISTPPASDWFVDTGATTHMTPSLANLNSFAPYSESDNAGSSGQRHM